MCLKLNLLLWSLHIPYTMLMKLVVDFKKNQIVMLIDTSTKSDTYIGWSFTTSSSFANCQIFQNACQEIFIHVFTVILLVPCTNVPTYTISFLIWCHLHHQKHCTVCHFEPNFEPSNTNSTDINSSSFIPNSQESMNISPSNLVHGKRNRKKICWNKSFTVLV